MSHQDNQRDNGSAYNHQDLRAALDWLLSDAALSGVEFREDCCWTPLRLVCVALLWAWSDEKSLTERFVVACKIVTRGWRLRDPLATSYQSFMKMLRRWTPHLRSSVQEVFRRRMRGALSSRWKIAGFIVFSVDGSRLEMPRTASNQARFAPRNSQSCQAKKKRQLAKARRRRLTKQQRAERAREKKAAMAQMWLTTMWHVGSGLPWDWRTGPADSIERQHLLEMIDTLPPQALVTADAGFVGYDYWKTLSDSGRQFVIRVGSNVRLLKKLGYAKERSGIVYLWPERAASQCLPPLVLRLVVVKTGRHPVYLVTSVLDEKQLSDAQVVELYRRRWGIEVFYRHFKQTFERRKLRSKSADNAQCEADWSLLGLWAMMLHAQCELKTLRIPARRISVAGMLRAYRKPMREYKSRPDTGEDLQTLIRSAIIDDYQRTDKASRDYPRKKQEQAAGPPVIILATAKQKQQARQTKRDAEKGLTA
jgi:hypothetical protein